jgi:uncharacterized membrane protein YcaP (DUF421 family)
MDSVIRAAVVYAFIFLLFRISGKRTLAEVTPFDLVLALIMSEAIQQALIDADNSLTNAFLVVTTLIAIDAALLWGTQRWKGLDRVVNGLPLVILEDGKLLRDRMDREWVVTDDILTAARQQGLARLDQIKYAILERDGNITVIPREGGGG